MLVFSDLFDVVSEFSLEVIWMVICLKLNALYHIKHTVLKLFKIFYVRWRAFRFETVCFLGRRVVGVGVKEKESLPTHTLNQRFSLLNQSLTESGFACQRNVLGGVLEVLYLKLHS